VHKQAVAKYLVDSFRLEGAQDGFAILRASRVFEAIAAIYGQKREGVDRRLSIYEGHFCSR
jgi:hypothetical protein